MLLHVLVDIVQAQSFIIPHCITQEKLIFIRVSLENYDVRVQTLGVGVRESDRAMVPF